MSDTETHWHLVKFYVAVIAYFVLHMIFVIASDFVDSFNIPPINIGIYVGKLVSLRSLLMFVSSVLEWPIGSQDPGLEKLTAGKKKIRRSCSLMSFLAMLVCRAWYLYLIYKSDKKALTVFITLSVESFWFGLFQISFFAIGPKYAAASTLGVHTMGNFIFGLQLFLERLAKTNAKLDPLYRVRVHGWISLATSALALAAWSVFCYDVKGTGDSGNSDGDPNAVAGASAFLMFPIGSAIKDFLYPGVLPFGLLDPGKAALINYWTPVFIMAGAIFVVVVTAESVKKQVKFEEWIKGNGHEWHAVWLWLLPMATSYLISMWCIHGTFARLRCIVQSRWRVWLLSLFVIVPNSFLEDISYVGVAAWATADLSKTNNLNLIPAHNMLAMLCRFLNGKLAVGYNWTRVDMGYCLPKFRPRHRGFGFGFWWWCGRVLARAWADTAKDFKADVKNYL